jgi:hypothetical protein
MPEVFIHMADDEIGATAGKLAKQAASSGATSWLEEKTT